MQIPKFSNLLTVRTRYSGTQNPTTLNGFHLLYSKQDPSDIGHRYWAVNLPDNLSKEIFGNILNWGPCPEGTLFFIVSLFLEAFEYYQLFFFVDIHNFTWVQLPPKLNDNTVSKIVFHWVLGLFCPLRAKLFLLVIELNKCFVELLYATTS